MKCKYDNDSIICYIDGELEDIKKVEFEEHLKSCDRCAKKFKTLAYTKQYFRQGVKSEQFLVNSVMNGIDKNRYKNNTKLTKVSLVFYRYKPVWKTAFSVTAAMFLAILVFRYSGTIVEIKDNIVAAITHMENKEDSANNDFETQQHLKDDVIVSLETPTKSPTSVPSPTEDSNRFIPNMAGIKEIMTLNKKQVIKRLGSNYKMVYAGAEHAQEGYRYENYGMTIIFENSEISLIECDEKISINGAKLGMKFSEIKSVLGEGESRELVPIEPEQPRYALFYTYNHFRIWFGSMEENGVATDMQIRRFSDGEQSIPSDFYDFCIKKAKNQTQIEELTKLKDDRTHGIGYYKRDALIIIGELPNNQKRLSLAQAENLINSKNNSREIIADFNKIAGAPDFEGGSGMTYTYYFLDDKHSEAVYVLGDSLFSYIKYDDDGKKMQSKSLGRDSVPRPLFSPKRDVD